MGKIVAKRIIGANQGGRVNAAFKDGIYARYVDVVSGNKLQVTDTEGNVIYTEYGLTGENGLSIHSLDVETSSFDGSVLFIVGGFTAETDNSVRYVVKADYHVAPEMVYGAPGNTVDDVG
jgi:hypothetical protein